MNNSFKSYLQAFVLVSALSCNNAKVSEQESEKIDAESAYINFSELNLDASPEEVEEVFTQFSLTHFGSLRDSLYKSAFGEHLLINEESEWSYVSETSASISWETNLPAKTYVEYGETQALGHKTEIDERYYFVHLHYLRSLKPKTKYYYRLVAEDEKHKRVTSQIRVLHTKDMSHALRIPGDLGDPPFVLDQFNATYLITEDIVGEQSTIVIAAEGITLDLGGNTLTHANELIHEVDFNEVGKSGVGIRWRNGGQQSGLKIFNGRLKQGRAKNNAELIGGESMLKPDPALKEKYKGSINRGFSNIELSGKSEVEIAGVTAEYHLPQSWGMRFEDASGVYNIHHNVFLDKGVQLFDRHGAGGARSLGFVAGERGSLDATGAGFRVHHNLIKRTRQNAINVAREIYNNEIYVDSWSVNSFAIQPSTMNGSVFNNKIFLTGYYSCGILWASSDLKVNDNFIHMEGVKTMIEKPEHGRRLIETWGEQDVLAGMRVTNYSKGGQERQNLFYENNVIIGKSRDGSELRGTEFFSDYSNKDFLFRNSIIKIESLDSLPSKSSTINTQGAYNDRTLHLPIFYEKTVSISNLCNIRFGDDYGQGSNHRFVNCRIVKSGNHPDYHTFVFDGGNSVFNHILLDCEFEQGASVDDVYWERTGSLSNYSIQWTLALATPPNADIKITDKNGTVRFKGTADSKGIAAIPLTQFVIRPIEWAEGQEEVSVTEKALHQKEEFSPYTVEIAYRGSIKSRVIEMDKRQKVSIQWD